jgi:hypothetical protein
MVEGGVATSRDSSSSRSFVPRRTASLFSKRKPVPEDSEKEKQDSRWYSQYVGSKRRGDRGNAENRIVQASTAQAYTGGIGHRGLGAGDFWLGYGPR